MKEIEFNLLTEPWIRVRLRDNTVREVSQGGCGYPLPTPG